MKIICLGGNVVDWNSDIPPEEIARIAKTSRDKDGRKVFSPVKEQVFRLRGRTTLDLILKAGGINSYDKNLENKKVWELTLPSSKTPSRVLNCVQRPGGGATNNYHVITTLARDMHSKYETELIVSEPNKHVQCTLESELLQDNYFALRAGEKELNNVNFRCNGYKISYTSAEGVCKPGEVKDMKKKLEERLQFTKGDVLVVNSVKDNNYLNAVLDCYSRAGVKPLLVAAVTNSMLAKRGAGLNVDGLIGESDIYASNFEEFFELMKKKAFHHVDRPEDLSYSDMYKGMREILEKSGKKKRRVYVTCGDTGVLAMDSDGSLYFQKVSGLIKGPNRKERIEDINGAGDSFLGAMVLLEAKGYSFMRILDYANAAAQVSTRYKGANMKAGITVEKINEFRRVHPKGIVRYNPDTGEFDGKQIIVRCAL